jgi:hypothetical protein
MQLVEKKITLNELSEMSKRMFGGLVKAVVDMEKQIMVVDAAMHADEEALLLKDGSKQENLWGINLYPELASDEDFIEFDSMINIRPSQKNFSRSVENIGIQNQIKELVARLVQK